MLYFSSDYMEGCHPNILRRLSEINMDKNPGYGTDAICESAKNKIRAACGKPDAEVSFLVGGTQTNAVVIKSMLRSYEGVVAAATGHVAVHEAGAIEAGGHKVLTLPEHNGKLDAAEVEEYIATFYKDANHEHMVKPGMVYISHPTEYGTLYTKAELEALHSVCAKYDIPLFLDGARLGYGLAATGTDVTLETIADNCDVFYIGGTKVGAMFGEAVVFTGKAPEGFFSIIKQNGALLAKGWMLGVQFDELFTDGLYMKCGKNAIDCAERLKAGLISKGYNMYLDSPTNQQFIVIETAKLEELGKQVAYGFMETYDAEHTVIRFATSWATRMEDVEKLIELL